MPPADWKDDKLPEGIGDITVPIFGADGKREHYFRQSSLKDIDLCMERARRTMSGLMPDGDTDANCAGTAVHYGIELELEDVIEGGPGYGLAASVEAAQQYFTELTQLPTFTWVKRNEVQARLFITRCLEKWFEEVRGGLRPAATEIKFGPLLIHEDGERRIYLTGTIDYLDAKLGLMDWKTAGRKWEAWEHERWDLQASAYTLAADLVPIAPALTDVRGRFEFVVLAEHRLGVVKLQRIPVLRTKGDCDFFIERCRRVALLIEQEVPVWPLNDNHALCSPKWCPAWSDCKGKYVDAGWPRSAKG